MLAEWNGGIKELSFRELKLLHHMKTIIGFAVQQLCRIYLGFCKIQ